MVTSMHLSNIVPFLRLMLLLPAGCTLVSEASDGFPSVHMQQFKVALHAYKPHSPATEAELEQELGRRNYPSLPSAPSMLRQVANVDVRTVAGFKVIELVPRVNASDLRILYLHGGSYAYELSEPHLLMLAELIDQTGASVSVPVYPLAPEFTYADASPFVQQVYRELLEAGPASNMVLGGDSAGGGLAVSQLLTYRALGLDLPHKVFLFSPWLDVTMSQPDIPTLEGTDCMLVSSALRVHGRWWAGDEDPGDPRFSPLFGELSGLPPTIVFGGTDELLLPDIRNFARHIAAERVLVRDGKTETSTDARSLYVEYPGAIHDFPLLKLAPEAGDALARVAAFIKE